MRTAAQHKPSPAARAYHIALYPDEHLLYLLYMLFAYIYILYTKFQ